jgi:DNA invertase Pin-like site-specific DNA recombinase
MRQIVSYSRVSTDKQGEGGVGIEAPRADIARLPGPRGWNCWPSYIEVETGKGADALERRPVLAASPAQAREAKASVVVAKLDRHSRDDLEVSRGARSAQKTRLGTEDADLRTATAPVERATPGRAARCPGHRIHCG